MFNKKSFLMLAFSTIYFTNVCSYQGPCNIKIGGETELCYACRLGDVQRAKLLVKKGANVNKAGYFGETPLLCACRDCNIEFAKLLIEYGADVNKADDRGITPLEHILIYNAESPRSEEEDYVCCLDVDPNTKFLSSENWEMAKFLIAKGADVNKVDQDGWTLFKSALSQSNLKVIRFLFENGADVNMVDNDGFTPLFSSVISRDSSADEIGAQLLKAKIEILLKSLPFPKTPSQEKIEETMKIYGMCTFYENPNPNKYENCDIPVIVFFSSLVDHAELEKGYSFRSKLTEFSFAIDDFGTFKSQYEYDNARKFISMAEQNIYHVLSKYQIKKAMIIRRMRNLVRKMGKEEAFKLKKFKELTAEKIMVSFNIERLKLTYKENAERIRLEKAGQDALQSDAIKLLREKNKVLQRRRDEFCREDINRQDSEGNTTLTWAAKNGFIEIVKALLDHEDVEINRKSNNGCTALIYASMNGHTEIVNDLLKHTDKKIYKKRSSLFRWAHKNGHPEIIEGLFNLRNINVNERSNHNNTALIWATYQGHEKIVKALLRQSGIDVNVQGVLGKTALDWALKRRFKKIAGLLQAATAQT